jgi:hypothetical protein
MELGARQPHFLCRRSQQAQHGRNACLLSTHTHPALLPGHPLHPTQAI